MKPNQLAKRLAGAFARELRNVPSPVEEPSPAQVKRAEELLAKSPLGQAVLRRRKEDAAN